MVVGLARETSPRPPEESRAGSTIPLALSDARDVMVVHRTVFQLKEGADMLRVFQVKPGRPAWYHEEGTGSEPIRSVALTPPDADLWQNNDKTAVCWRWERKSPRPGEFAFESRFVLHTARRSLPVSGVRLTWQQLDDEVAGWPEKDRPTKIKVPAEITALARSIRAKHGNPLDAVHDVCTWVRTHIKYETQRIPYAVTDLDAILANRKGWCGHRETVFRAICQELGVPCRRSQGFVLSNLDGFVDGHVDWNRHGWSQVYFPHLGWVEAEPSATGNPFTIPWTYVKTSEEVQSVIVWVQRKGTWTGITEYQDTVRCTPATRASKGTARKG
jgi:hypothetical protein